MTDITEEAQAKRTFATDEDGDPVDAGAAIASGKTLTARAVGVALQNLNYHTGETSTTTDVTASIKRNDDGALTVTIDGEELAFTPADVNGEGDGYEVEVDIDKFCKLERSSPRLAGREELSLWVDGNVTLEELKWRVWAACGGVDEDGDVIDILVQSRRNRNTNLAIN